jgi:thiol:disulfide interchange protein/DsbC/DsbD-like thiol-disulfide interchange protein
MTSATVRALLRPLLLLWLVAAGSAWADAPPAPGAHHLLMRLVAESDRPRAGGTVTLAIDTRPEAGWHGYWRNPGDAGLPTKLDWKLPAGVTADEPAWPVPGTLLIAGLMNYVYDRPYAPLVELSVPAGLSPGTRLPVRVHADYLVCTTSLCVPETSDLSLDLVVGDGAPVRRARFDAWRRAIPRPLGGLAHWQAAGGAARIAVPYPAAAPLSDAYFFPTSEGALNYAAPQHVARDGDRLVIDTAAAPGAKGSLDGVLRIGGGQSLAVHAEPGAVAPAPDAGAAPGWRAAVLAFLGAVLGGVVLNVMPCVFPILSLKALQLARSGTGAREARGEALAYTAGVMLVCAGLGAVILLLRAGGASVGWGFQLQNPRVILALALLTAAIGLNLLGLFELPTPRLGRAGEGGGAFATGALAAVVATPCTGPFMGAAFGAALVLPAAAALAVFAGLGLGLALPFLVIGFVPALRRRLPRPGAWMVTLRRVLALPMLLTAAWLASVLWTEAGAPAVARIALPALVVLGALLWWAGRRQQRGLSAGPMLAGAAAAVLCAAALPPGAGAARAAVAGDEPFSEARLETLRAQHRPVFAYFTADWCFTCKVNERGAIETAAVRDAFRKGNVAVLEGDWTNGDPALGRFLEAHGRAGVPLYLYYAPGAADAQVLPQVLTPGILTAIAR